MYPSEYIQYLVHFHGDRDYFECHEILEEYWKHTDPGNKDSIWVGFILLAVSAYHHRRGNFSGAKRTLEKAVKLFKQQADSLPILGIDAQRLFLLLDNRLREIQARMQYSSITLPISDSELQEQCFNICHEHNFSWGKESDLSNSNLIHRHKLRDRTDVIEERNKAMKAKKAANN